MTPGRRRGASSRPAQHGLQWAWMIHLRSQWQPDLVPRRRQLLAWPVIDVDDPPEESVATGL
eukprot:370067-Lingulodinium_polyedra.AAC.1